MDSYWVYFAAFYGFANNVEQWLVLCQFLFGVDSAHCQRVYVCFITVFVHKISRVPNREVLDYFNWNGVPLTLECHLNLLRLNLDEFKTWILSLAYSRACLALKLIHHHTNLAN